MKVSTLGPAVADDAQGASVPWAAAPDLAREPEAPGTNYSPRIAEPNEPAVPDLTAEWSEARECVRRVAEGLKSVTEDAVRAGGILIEIRKKTPQAWLPTLKERLGRHQPTAWWCMQLAEMSPSDREIWLDRKGLSVRRAVEGYRKATGKYRGRKAAPSAEVPAGEPETLPDIVRAEIAQRIEQALDWVDFAESEFPAAPELDYARGELADDLRALVREYLGRGCGRAWCRGARREPDVAGPLRVHRRPLRRGMGQVAEADGGRDDAHQRAHLERLRADLTVRLSRVQPSPWPDLDLAEAAAGGEIEWRVAAARANRRLAQQALGLAAAPEPRLRAGAINALSLCSGIGGIDIGLTKRNPQLPNGLLCRVGQALPGPPPQVDGGRSP